MTAVRRSFPARAEQLIGALVPGPLPRPTPIAAPMPTLPSRRPPADPNAVPLLDIARVDRSGRVSARALLRLLRWTAGRRVDIGVVDGTVVMTAAVEGAYVVGSRGDLALPAAARAMCGVTDDVVVVGYPSHRVVVIYPAATVARLLHERHFSAVIADVD